MILPGHRPSEQMFIFKRRSSKTSPQREPCAWHGPQEGKKTRPHMQLRVGQAGRQAASEGPSPPLPGPCAYPHASACSRNTAPHSLTHAPAAINTHTHTHSSHLEHAAPGSKAAIHGALQGAPHSLVDDIHALWVLSPQNGTHVLRGTRGRGGGHSAFSSGSQFRRRVSDRVGGGGCQPAALAPRPAREAAQCIQQRNHSSEGV